MNGLDLPLRKLRGLDLFSGIGGITLALSPWAHPIAYCENDKHAQSVLLARMATGDLPAAPIWDDVQTLTGAMLPPIDIIYGGFPCQDISVAGSGRGLAGKRSALFFEIMRLAKETKPAFIFLENVPAIRKRGLSTVGEQLAHLGYDCRWGVVSAYDVGAPHFRERWFMLAHANSHQIRLKQQWVPSRWPREVQAQRKALTLFDGSARGWAAQSPVDRVADGVSYRMERLRGLGNAVVPAQAREAFKRLAGINVNRHDM